MIGCYDPKFVLGEEANWRSASQGKKFRRAPPLPDPGVPVGLKIPLTPFFSIPRGVSVCIWAGIALFGDGVTSFCIGSVDSTDSSIGVSIGISVSEKSRPSMR